MEDQPGPQTDPLQNDSLRNFLRGLLKGWNEAQDGDDPLHIQADELEVNLDHGDDSVAVYGETSGGSQVALRVDSDGQLQVDLLGEPLDVSAATVPVEEQGKAASAGSDTTGGSGGSAALNGGTSLAASRIVIEADSGNGAPVLVGVGGTNVLELGAGELAAVPIPISDVSNVTVESTNGNQQTVNWIAA